MGGLKLQDLNWGMLNEISDTRQGQLTGDRRRTSTSTMLRRFATNAYTPDTVGARKEYQGFVVSHRPINYATYQNPGSMLQEYVILTNFTAPAGADSAHQEAGRYNNLAYKVYIPELEPRPAPRGADDPVLRTYPDVFSALPGKQALPLGTLVAVRYENPQHLARPKIVRVIDYGIGIENVSVDKEGKVLATAFYQGRVPGTMGGMPAGTGGGTGAPVVEQEITGIPNIKKSSTNKESDKYTHWGDDPAMKTLLVALNAGAQKEGTTLTINSALRTPYNQVRIMFQNYKKKGGLQDRAFGRKYLTGLYNAAAGNAIADAFERGNYTTEKQAGAGAGHLAAKGGGHFHISAHQLGKAVDVAFGRHPNPSEKVCKALVAAAKENKGIDILMESDHFHVSYKGPNTASKFRKLSKKGGPTAAQVASVAPFGLVIGDIEEHGGEGAPI